MNTIVAAHKPTKNTKNVWVVYIAGTEEGKQFCKSAYTAMKYMFILKARTGAVISENCLQRLRHEQALLESEDKAKAEAKVEIVEEVGAEKLPEEKPAKPKAKRGRPKKKVA